MQWLPSKAPAGVSTIAPNLAELNKSGCKWNRPVTSTRTVEVAYLSSKSLWTQYLDSKQLLSCLRYAMPAPRNSTSWPTPRSLAKKATAQRSTWFLIRNVMETAGFARPFVRARGGKGHSEKNGIAETLVLQIRQNPHLCHDPVPSAFFNALHRHELNRELLPSLVHLATQTSCHKNSLSEHEDTILNQRTSAARRPLRISRAQSPHRAGNCSWPARPPRGPGSISPRAKPLLTGGRQAV